MPKGEEQTTQPTQVKEQSSNSLFDVLYQALNKANLKGVYSLDESKLILNVFETLKKSITTKEI